MEQLRSHPHASAMKQYLCAEKTKQIKDELYNLFTCFRDYGPRSCYICGNYVLYKTDTFRNNSLIPKKCRCKCRIPIYHEEEYEYRDNLSNEPSDNNSRYETESNTDTDT
jgi:hypothetical protein